MTDCVRTSTGVLTTQLRCGCENVDPTINQDCEDLGTGSVGVTPKSPLVCGDCDEVGTGSISDFPVPCAYKAIRLCPKTHTATVGCAINATDYDIPAWITERIVFRTICSNKGLNPKCTYAALSPRAFWPGTTWFGETGPLALTKIGADWDDLEDRNNCTQAVPCSWRDSTYSNVLGRASWTDCNGAGGIATCLPYSTGYEVGGSSQQPTDSGAGNIALMLDPEAGTITPTNWFEAVGLPSFPSYILKPGTTWNCHGCNKFVKVPAAVGTGSGTGTGVPAEDGWGMPELLEIVPVIEDARIACEPTEADPCSPTLTTEDNKCHYDTKAHRSECCDNCCDQLPPQPLFIRCGECSASATVTPTIGGGNGLDGVDSPVGPTYGASLTGCGHTMDVNWYCRGGVSGWAADVYVDGDLCETVSLTHQCCPLVLGTGTVNCLPDCEVCIGEGCGDGCCPDEPTEIVATLSSDCPELDGQVVTLTGGGGTHNWGGDTYFGLYGVTVGCNNGVWTLGVGYSGCSLTSEATSASCDPFSLEFPAGYFVATPGLSCTPCAEGTWVSASVTL